MRWSASRSNRSSTTYRRGWRSPVEACRATRSRCAVWRRGRRRCRRVVSTDPRLSLVVEQALADIAALRIIDSAHVDRPVIAAGAPWFMTLFGRDSLLTSWMTLPFDPDLAVGVLSTLAELQGQRLRPGRRGAAGQDPPRVAPPRRRRTVRESTALLRHRRRHATVRDARRRSETMGSVERRRSGRARRPPSTRPSGGFSATAIRMATGSSTINAAMRRACPTKAGRIRGTA